MLSDDDINEALDRVYGFRLERWELEEGGGLVMELSRAIESAATAPLLARIAELEAANEAFGKRQEWWNARMLELEQQLAEARKDAADADSMCEAMKKVIDQNDARWKFLHTTNKDSEGFEWCVLRVKWENGRISEALHTYSNMADLDAAIKEQT